MKKALIINMIFSGLSGLIMLLFPDYMAKIFNIASSTPFIVFGIALIVFSLTILYEVKKQNSARILWIITQDILWVTGSIYLLIFNPFEISSQGNIIIGIVAIFVLMMAVNQASALAKKDAGINKGDKQLHYSRIIKATKTATWKVISDVGNFHKVAPNIDDVKITGEGKGMIRRCSHGKDSWTETCSIWKEEEIYEFLVNTSAPDYPFPLKYLKGSWKVQEVDADHTKIIMTFYFIYKYKILNILVHPFLRSNFQKITDELLDNWQFMLEKNEFYKNQIRFELFL